MANRSVAMRGLVPGIGRKEGEMRVVSVFAICILGLTACNEVPDVELSGMEVDSSQEEDLARLQVMQTEIIDFIGEPICSMATDCASSAFGVKPCGGPWKYLIYSLLTVDVGELNELIEEYDAFNAVVNERYKLSSTCEFADTPVLDCIDSVCIGEHSGQVRF